MISQKKISDLYQLFRLYSKVSTDSRCVGEGSIFFALRGENFDGNKYAAAALSKGAAIAVVDDECVAVDERFFVVDDVLEALQQLANHHRRQLGIPILAITGTNGKTTTKELVAAVLATKMRVTATSGNLNNHIGVPLTLLSMDSSTEFGVVEMGASAQGEIFQLSTIAEPNFGLITNVGYAHLDGFGGIEGVKSGKGELYDFLRESGGTAFVRGGDDVLCNMANQREGLNVVEYHSSLADNIETSLVGEYNKYNIAAAMAIGSFFEVELDEVKESIANYVPDNNRSQSVRTQNNLLIVDCYNANPSSMGAAIDSFAHENVPEYGQKIIVLGDMLELGEWTDKEHQRITKVALDSKCDKIYFVGKLFGRNQIVNPRSTYFDTVEQLRTILQEKPIKNSFVLIKGSRGGVLEKLIDLL